MESPQTAADVLRKVLFLALFGFLAVMLAGPVLALVSIFISLILSVVAVVLPFALIGLLLWLPFQALVLGRKIDWHKIGRAGGVFFRGAFGALGGVVRGGFRILGAVGSKLKAVALFVSRIVLDLVGGALAGGVLGVIGGKIHGDVEGRVPIAMLIGAGVGLVVALARLTERSKPAVTKEAPKPVKEPERPRAVVNGLKGCVEIPAR
jgi:hypothetical protein